MKKRRPKKPLRNVRELIDAVKEDEIFVKHPGRVGYPGFENLKANFLFDESCRVSYFAFKRCKAGNGIVVS